MKSQSRTDGPNGPPCAVAVGEPETGHPVRHGHPQGEGAFRAEVDLDHGHPPGAPLVRLATTADAAPSIRAHPGMLYNAGDINRAEVRVAAGTDPWLRGWNEQAADRHSPSTWTNLVTAMIIRGDTGENHSLLFNDIGAAYRNALRRQVGGTESNAASAARILNAWSTTLTSVTGNADRFLAAGLYGRGFANACAPMRGYSGFDLAAAQEMPGTCAPWPRSWPSASSTSAVPYLYTDPDGYALDQWHTDYGTTRGGFDQLGLATLVYAK
ncbi:hypothetical protein ABZ379_09295 [Streptomyces canus]|uniref:hypothetical protein n=1 Tax=Streptomyces canus TaxID=58343 RepID=UPI0033D36213